MKDGFELLSLNFINQSDFYSLLLRLFLNVFFLTIIIRFLYYPKTKRKDYLFTYYLIGMITFFLCFSLKKLDIDTGMGLGLFAIFGIIRYRTDAIEIKEMTYLFLVIGLSVVNAMLATEVSKDIYQINLFELGLINLAIVIIYSQNQLAVLIHTFSNFLFKQPTNQRFPSSHTA